MSFHHSKNKKNKKKKNPIEAKKNKNQTFTEIWPYFFGEIFFFDELTEKMGEINFQKERNPIEEIGRKSCLKLQKRELHRSESGKTV